MSDCHYYRLAFKYSFERKGYHDIEFISLESLPDRDVSQATLLIHLTEKNHPAIIHFIENIKLFLTKNSIVIANKQLITLLSRYFDERLRFIDELSIFVECSNNVLIEENIESRDSLSEVKEKLHLLSISELLVMLMLLTGQSLSAIAFRTKRSIKTISTQKVCALKKLDLDNTPYSMIKLAHAFRFPASLGSLKRRSAIDKGIVKLRGEQCFHDTHTENKMASFAEHPTEYSVENKVSCEGEASVNLNAKIIIKNEKRRGKKKLTVTPKQKKSFLSSWITALLKKLWPIAET
ncbi:hypothetical protein [Serratia sp. (in: enterobacteria)]|uniref:hypothetical protein n=1 Tax=Serratia sp. (in: enterobacteria) TaxID=616 RepID=UPI0039893054